MPINKDGDFEWSEEEFQRVKEAIEAPSYTAPDGLTREQWRQWVKDCADGKIEPDN